MKRIMVAILLLVLISTTGFAYNELAKGSKGPDVVKLQEALISQGYLEGKADGDYGMKTATAVTAFQATYGLPETGVADSTTQSILFGEEESDQETENKKIFRSNGLYYSILDNGTIEIVEFYRGYPNLTIPSEEDGYRITKLCRNAFHDSNGIKSVTIPDDITEIEGNPFVECSELTEINVSPVHPTLATIDGVLFSKEDKRLICYPRSLKADTYTIPQGISAVGESAFEGCGNLETIELPESMLEIEGNPFIDCKSLKSIVVSTDNSIFESINGSLFNRQKKELILYYNTDREDQYSIPQGTEIIGSYAFNRKFNLKSIKIPESVKSIDEAAFAYCSNLSELMLPEGVEYMGDYVFAHCSNLEQVSFPDKLTHIKEGTCYGCANLLSVEIPESVISIGEGAFGECSRLQSIRIPDAVNIMGANPFMDCEQLSDIQISETHPTFGIIDGLLVNKKTNKLISWPCRLIADSCSIPESITSIGNLAFYGCSNLKYLTIPENVTNIDEWAFAGCDNLTLLVVRDSYAEKFCQEHQLRYSFTDGNDWLNN